MPLLIANEPFNSEVKSLQDFLNLDMFKEAAEKLKSLAPREVPPDKLLYVNQREYAVVSPDDQYIKIIGTDDATTCHIATIRHTGSGVLGLSHCDGCDTERGLTSMVDKVISMSQGAPDGILVLTLTGGFCDKKKESEKLSKEIIGVFQKLEHDIHLVNCCITDLNNKVRGRSNFPYIYGLGMSVSSGDIFPASFHAKGPAIDVRSACHFGGCQDLMNIYDNSTGQVVIGPYDWKSWEDVDKWISLPDSIIRKYLSTSPEQEPPYFEEHVRQALKVLSEHPTPLQTLFLDGKPHRYKLEDDGEWTRVD